MYLKAKEQNKKTGSLYYKVLSYVLFVVLMSVISVLIISLVSIKKSMTKEYRELVQVSVSNIDQSFTQYYKNCDSYAVSLFSSVYGIKSRIEENYVPAHITKYVDIIDDVYDVLPFVQSYTLINSQNEVAFTVSNKNNANHLTSSFQKEIISKLNSFPYTESAFLWTTANYTAKSDIPLLSIYYREFLPESKFYNGASVINVDLEALSNALFSNTYENSVLFYVINSDGQIVAHSDTDMCGKNLLDYAYIQNIINEGTQLQKVRIDKKTYEIFSVPSSLKGYYIVAQTKNINALTKYSSSFKLLLIVTVIIIIGAIVSLYILITKVFRPLNRVITDLKASDIARGLNLNQDDAELLEQYHKEALSYINQLKRNNIKSEIVKKLLSRQEIDRFLIEHGFIDNSCTYYICLFHLNIDSGFSRWNSSPEDIQEQLGKIFRNMFSENTGITCFEIESNIFMVLLSQNSNYKSINTEICSHIEAAYNIVCNELHYLTLAYISPKIQDGGNYTCLQAYQSGSEHIKTHLNLEPEKNVLIDASKINEEKWQSTFDAVVDAAKGQNDSSFFNILHSAIDFLLCFEWDNYLEHTLKLAIGIIHSNPSNKSSFENSKDKIQQKIKSIASSTDLYEWLVLLYKDANAWMENDDSVASPPIVERVTKYIKTNYSDCDLNLSSIAKEMCISPAYLGKLFRDTNGITFNSYLMKTRLEEAQHLLTVETDLNITDISEKVGFSNSTYFITSFKSQYGVTPSKYRDYQLWNAQKKIHPNDDKFNIDSMNDDKL